MADEVDRRRGGKSAVVEEALVSVTRLAEVKEVFDRFAVDSLMTGEDVIQALTELGTTSPRSQISRYLRARKMSGMQVRWSGVIDLLSTPSHSSPTSPPPALTLPPTHPPTHQPNHPLSARLTSSSSFVPSLPRRSSRAGSRPSCRIRSGPRANATAGTTRTRTT